MTVDSRLVWGIDSRGSGFFSRVRREYRGTEHHVTVLDKGFEYDGRRYRSLSRIAREITGTNWNGYLFFKIDNRRVGGAS